MAAKPKVKETLSAIKLLPGVSIYPVKNSKFWYLRIWDDEQQKYKVTSTGEFEEED
jgi:hypothetical protein